MRKVQKTLALELLQMLADSHRTAAGYMERGMPDAALSVFADCQQCAIRLGEFIEHEEGVDDFAVRTLESYCELLYQASRGLSDPVHAKKTLEQLHQALLKVEQHITQDIPTTIEVVFLPYKASMWDSMESIWRAADADPHCNAYVVPIPYYDRNPDCTLGLRHYEGELYPPEVPAVHYSEYDLEKRRPDVVFIHNPYDDCNRVTTVDPEYYSDKVKAHTDCLVYVDYGIPYWIPLKPNAAGGFLSSVYLHSDLIIFHSQEYAENMRIHINQVAPEEMRRNAVGKVVALGSPKFDAVLHASREDYPLPSAWQQRINGKKVLLYSTALKALLEETEQFITRLVAELKFFRKQEDVVLWWRPHPLSAATLFGMRPNLLQKYEQIVTQYQREGWGIYDETTLLHRAIAWSDGCYTDESSLLFLYLATGKPFVCRTFYQLKHQVSEPSQDFTPILDRQIANMQTARGANIYHETFCNFQP